MKQRPSYLVVLACLTTSMLPLPAQNPATICATVSIFPGAATCVHECTQRCDWNEWDSGGMHWISCNCNNQYSSACCNLQIGFNTIPEYEFRAVGLCSGICGDGGKCQLKEYGETTVAQCPEL